ncbi:MAG TPA: ATP-binding protein [Candidatus Cybelea sp.]|nr:ATP-binding protein [Candidatus Cybelea sp.]
MKSIRRQLTLSILAGFGLLLVCSSAAIYFSTRVALVREFDAGLRAKALTLMSLTEQGQDGIQIELPDASLQAAGNDVSAQFYELWRTNGSVCTRAPSLKNSDLPFRFGSVSEPAYWDLQLPDNSAGRAIGLKFTPKAEDEHTTRFVPVDAILVVAADRRSLDRTLNALALILVVTGLLTIGITVPLVNVSLRRGHAPLGRLSRHASAITADSLHTRFPVDSIPAELQPIIARLNDLLSRLEQSFERERRFSADLAHELRTPLAELRSHAEVELAWPDGADAGKHRETLDIALQMETMVTRLLQLARCENGKISLQTEPILVAQLVTEAWQPLASDAGVKHLAVDFDVPQNVELQTDPALFRSILDNLFSNAVEYASPNGRVRITWSNDAQELTVSNPVHDLNPDDVPHLFERLWRKDKSRTGTEHCGLGLPLSREFAAMLGFSLTASFNGEKTLVLTLKRLPSRPESNLKSSA